MIMLISQNIPYKHVILHAYNLLIWRFFLKHCQQVILNVNVSSVNSPFQWNSRLWKITANAAKNEITNVSLVSLFDGINVVIH